MILYIDSAMLSGFIMNYLCLDTAASVAGIKVKKLSVISGALFFSAMSVACLFSNKVRLVCLLIYIPSLRLIFGKCSVGELMRRAGIAVGCSMNYTALLLGTVPYSKIEVILCGGGHFFAAEDMAFYMPLGLVYIAAKVVLFYISKPKLIYDVVIELNGQRTEALAMIDTGNSLRHTASGSPVIIGERSLFGELSDEGELIPFKNISGITQYTHVYPVERLIFPMENREFTEVYISFTDKPLTSSGRYKVLLNNCFMN